MIRGDWAASAYYLQGRSMDLLALPEAKKYSAWLVVHLSVAASVLPLCPLDRRGGMGQLFQKAVQAIPQVDELVPERLDLLG
jgi:hypothetical protein